MAFIFHNIGTFTAVPNHLLDVVMPKVSPSAFCVLLALVRRTIGYQRTDTALSLHEIGSITGLGETTIRAAIESLENLRLIVVHRASGEKSKFSLNMSYDAEQVEPVGLTPTEPAQMPVEPPPPPKPTDPLTYMFDRATRNSGGINAKSLAALANMTKLPQHIKDAISDFLTFAPYDVKFDNASLTKWMGRGGSNMTAFIAAYNGDRALLGQAFELSKQSGGKNPMLVATHPYALVGYINAARAKNSVTLQPDDDSASMVV